MQLSIKLLYNIAKKGSCRFIIYTFEIFKGSLLRFRLLIRL